MDIHALFSGLESNDLIIYIVSLIVPLLSLGSPLGWLLYQEAIFTGNWP